MYSFLCVHLVSASTFHSFVIGVFQEGRKEGRTGDQPVQTQYATVAAKINREIGDQMKDSKIRISLTSLLWYSSTTSDS